MYHIKSDGHGTSDYGMQYMVGRAKCKKDANLRNTQYEMWQVIFSHTLSFTNIKQHAQRYVCHYAEGKVFNDFLSGKSPI